MRTLKVLSNLLETFRTVPELFEQSNTMLNAAIFNSNKHQVYTHKLNLNRCYQNSLANVQSLCELLLQQLYF
jgi:hypothetical protein